MKAAGIYHDSKSRKVHVVVLGVTCKGVVSCRGCERPVHEFDTAKIEADVIALDSYFFACANWRKVDRVVRVRAVRKFFDKHRKAFTESAPPAMKGCHPEAGILALVAAFGEDWDRGDDAREIFGMPIVIVDQDVPPGTWWLGPSLEQMADDVLSRKPEVNIVRAEYARSFDHDAEPAATAETSVPETKREELGTGSLVWEYVESRKRWEAKSQTGAPWVLGGGNENICAARADSDDWQFSDVDIDEVKAWCQERENEAPARQQEVPQDGFRSLVLRTGDTCDRLVPRFDLAYAELAPLVASSLAYLECGRKDAALSELVKARRVVEKFSASSVVIAAPDEGLA